MDTNHPIEVPYRLRKFPLWKGKYVIHYTVMIDPETAEPNFRVVDDAHRLQCSFRNWCHLCGEPLGRHMCFIGGPNSIKNRTFFDGPMHTDCAQYAAKVCPYLALSKEWVERPIKDMPGTLMHEVPESATGRPAKMGVLYCDSYNPIKVQRPDGSLEVFFRAGEPTRIDWTLMPEREVTGERPGIP